MEAKICSVCGTQNEPNYLFCKQCGTSLQNPASPPPYQENSAGYQAPSYGQPDSGYGYQQAPPNYPPYGQPQGFPPGGYPEEMIEGIPVSQMAAYLGPSNYSYIQKFLSLERTRSKTSFNGIVFVLGFLLGPLGASFWFLQKKLYQIGAILMIVGLIFNGINIAISYQFFDSVLEMSLSSAEMTEMTEMTEEQLRDSLASDDMLMAQIGIFFVVNTLISICSLVLSIVTAIFANHWYKSRAASVIRTLASESGYVDPQHLASRGGNSALWVLALILMILVGIIGSGVIFSSIISFATQMEGMTISLFQLPL